jgi:hypothetical protein
MSAGPTLYELLEVEETAGEHEITLAFRRVAKRWHPDLNSTLEATERMQHISAAYSVLRDPELRADYDRELHPQQPSCAEPGAVDDAAPAGCEPPTWALVASAPPIADAGPPPGFRTPPHPLSLHRQRSRRTERRDGRSATVAIPGGGHWGRLAAGACVLVCPGAPFLLAAARGGGATLARWGCAYVIATLLLALAAVTGAGLAINAGLPLTLIGALHAG